MKEQTKIPKSKIGRASKIAGAGIQVGVNYLKYQAKKPSPVTMIKLHFTRLPLRQHTTPLVNSKVDH
ncbi:hypothetical protein [Rubritalea profundi]|uniref:hypothetical protein n=1 Tax=Rubritalea profundi TaxID=1658618 RepID=UPI000CF4A8C1|nr:hypothetical protein [Rubritalea profundi]